MIFIFHPEIELKGDTYGECRRKALQLTELLRQLSAVEDVTVDMGDPACLEQLDPNPEMPLPDELRDRCQLHLIDVLTELEAEGHALREMVALGCERVGVREWPDYRVVEELLAQAEEPTDLAMHLLPYATHYGIDLPEWAKEMMP